MCFIVAISIYKQPNEKKKRKGGKPKQTFLHRKHTDGHKAHEKDVQQH